MEKWQQKENKTVNIIGQCMVPIMVYYVVHNVAAMAGLSLLQILKEKIVLEFAGASFWFYAETFVKMAAMALAGLFVYPYFKREKEGRMAEKLGGRDCLFLVMAGSVLSIGINFVFSVTGVMAGSEQYRQVAEVQFALPLGLGCVFYGILSPVVEEVVFRGIAYNALQRNIAGKMAIVGSALLFGAMHGNMVQMLYGSLMGVVLALAYQKYRNLWAPILLHGAANISVYVLTYFF